MNNKIIKIEDKYYIECLPSNKIILQPENDSELKAWNFLLEGQFQNSIDEYLKLTGESVFHNLGVICKIMGNDDNTVNYYSKELNWSQCDMNLRLANSSYRRKNYEEYEMYLLIAVKWGSLDAMCSLGTYYHEKEDYDNMFKYYIMAVETDANLYNKFFRDLRKINTEIMKKFILKGVELNIAAAMYNLANLYRKERKFNLMKKYYLMAIDKGDIESITSLGTFYRHKNVNKSIKYFLMGVSKDNLNAMENLALYYKDIKEYDLMIKYFLMVIENEKCKGIKCGKNGYKYNPRLHTLNRCLIKLGEYYEQIYDFKNMIKYYMQGVDMNHKLSMCKLGDYYEREGDYEQMKKYYLMAIKHGNTEAMCKLGDYYCKREIDFEQFEKYYLMAIKLNNIKAMCELGAFYKYMGEYDQMEKYYSMAIERGDFEANIILCEFFFSRKEYDIGLKYVEPIKECCPEFFEDVDDIKILLKYKDYLSGTKLREFNLAYCNYLSFLKESESIVNISGECPICLEEEVYCIKLICDHLVCYECYPKIEKCPLCRCEFMEF